jgi:hypothetical protein
MTEPSVDRSRWDVAALRSGIGACVTFAVPLQVLALVAGADSGWSLPLRLGALVGFFLGAGVAAWAQRRGLPLTHGLVTAIASFAVVQVGFIIGRAIAGSELRLFAAAVNLAPVVGVGLLGGYFGQALQRRGIVPGMRRPPT